MKENKLILKYCPNFHKIINFNPVDGDDLTVRIIRMYHDYIFTVDLCDEAAINQIKELDAAVSKYIDDYAFRKEVQRQMSTIKVKKGTNDIIKLFIDTIIKIFSSYEDYTTRVIYVSRWI